jgi:hypothetical protein
MFEGEQQVSKLMVDKKELSADEKKTQEYDALAFRLVSYGAIPLLAGYTVYSCESQQERADDSALHVCPPEAQLTIGRTAAGIRSS